MVAGSIKDLDEPAAVAALGGLLRVPQHISCKAANVAISARDFGNQPINDPISNELALMGIELWVTQTT